MTANKSKYKLSIAESDAKNFDVLSFTGAEEIGRPYRFDVEFKRSGAVSAQPDDGVLGESCRLDIEQNGETISYCGIVAAFGVLANDGVAAEEGADAAVHYTVGIAPAMHKLSLHSTSRIFQRTTVPNIIREVIGGAGLADHFEFKLDDGDTVKYPVREFCVQHNESDLDFISRLMEESGIWYRFKQVQAGGTVRECAVVSDDFSDYPLLGRSIPFMTGSGFSETAGADGKIVESVRSLCKKSALLPKNVRVRSYNHKTPQAHPDGMSDVSDGAWGGIYEYGGRVKNDAEAARRAELHAKRMWAQTRRTDGKSNSAALCAGTRVQIDHAKDARLAGTYLIISVRHSGGFHKGAYSYRNEFTGIRAEEKIYAPPLNTPVPRIDGIVTAPVGAAGGAFPTLDDHGYYNVHMPFDIDPANDGGAGDYGRSKHIRVAQPSCGLSAGDGGDKTYGFHFPAKQGAEMVLAYIDGDPDRPVGLGFVPNTASPSLVSNLNPYLNVMRTWGGNVLAMDDTPDSQKIVIAASGNDHFDKRENSITVGALSPNSELLLDNENKSASLRAYKHKIRLCYSEKDNSIIIETQVGNSITLDDAGESVTVKTKNGNVINMDDSIDVITVQSSSAENKVAVNGKDNAVTLDSKGNLVTVNGNDARITLESKDGRVSVDGKGKTIVMENKDNRVVIDGGGNTISLDAKKNITLKAGGKLVIDAKGGIDNKGAMLKMDS